MITCPHCQQEATLEHLRTSPECSKAVRSLIGLYRLSQRVTRAGSRPATPEPCPKCGEMVSKAQAVRGHGCASKDYAAMSQPIGKPFQLDPEARQALGRISPERAWLQVRTLVRQAIQEHYAEAEKMRLKANYPVDLTNLAEALEIGSPICGINHLHYANPDLKLTNIPKVPCLEVLQAVLNFLTVSERYQSFLP